MSKTHLDTIDDVLNWYKKTFPKRKQWTRKRHTGHLVKKLQEEVGELAEAYINPDISDRDRQYEIADIAIVLYAIVEQEGISLDDIVSKKLAVIKRRR